MAASIFASVFRDPAWLAVFLAGVFGVAAIAVAVLVARWQRGRTSLGYRVTTSSLLQSQAAGTVKLVYKDRELKRGGLATVRIVNDGNRPIPREAFDGPCLIDFGAAADIMSVEIGATNPGTLDPEVATVSGRLAQREALAELDREQGRQSPGDEPGFETMRQTPRYMRQDRIEIQPLLLNPGDWLQIQALVDGLEPMEVRVSARVEGVSELRPIGDADGSPNARLERGSGRCHQRGCLRCGGRHDRRNRNLRRRLGSNRRPGRLGLRKARLRNRGELLRSRGRPHPEGRWPASRVAEG